MDRQLAKRKITSDEHFRFYLIRFISYRNVTLQSQILKNYKTTFHLNLSSHKYEHAK